MTDEEESRLQSAPQLPNDFPLEFENLEDDEEVVDPRLVGEAYVTDTDWTAETILSQLRRGNIQLSPKFQRRDAWDAARKSRFIESLVIGLPIPQIVLAEERDKRGSFIVLDGKQRLLALSQFAAGSTLDTGQALLSNPLKLKNLEIKQGLAGLTLADIEAAGQLQDDLNNFLNQTVRTVVVRNWPNEDFLNLVFLRLNTGSVRLSPQELRQALHPGPFTDFLDDFASTSEPLRKALRLNGPDFRMRDVEILLRYYGLRTSLEEYRGNLRRFLDETTRDLNIAWTTQSDRVRLYAEEFNQALEATLQIFGADAFRRWRADGSGYERPFNRAVFDVMVYYFCDPSTRRAAIAKSEEVEFRFREVSEENAAFSAAVQATTKSIAALTTRLSVWGDVLTDLLGSPPPAPGLSQLKATLE